ncbi:MAG: type IV pilus assembly protein PilN [Candidatus Frackibacter sp. T328-2]|nr:MAG: type IV pilus assembly protein PilN [Candidatus Frackibacter sp. T328-2]
MINLLPPEYQEEGGVNIDKILVGILIFCLLLIPTSYYLKLVFQTKEVEKRLTIVEKNLSKLNQETKNLEQLENNYKQAKKELKTQMELVGVPIRWKTILQELKGVMNNKSWVEDFSIYNHNQFKMMGYTLERQKLTEIINRLKDSPNFNSVSIDFMRKKELSVTGYKKARVTYYQINGIIGNNEGDNYELK